MQKTVTDAKIGWNTVETEKSFNFVYSELLTRKKMTFLGSIIAFFMIRIKGEPYLREKYAGALADCKNTIISVVAHQMAAHLDGAKKHMKAQMGGQTAMDSAFQELSAEERQQMVDEFGAKKKLWKNLEEEANQRLGETNAARKKSGTAY